jgi:putative DNA primase/helicase
MELASCASQDPIAADEYHSCLLEDIEKDILCFPHGGSLLDKNRAQDRLIHDVRRLPKEKRDFPLRRLDEAEVMRRPAAERRLRILDTERENQAAPASPPWFKDKTFLPAVLAKEIANQHHFLTSPIDEAGVGVRLHVYKGGVFGPGGADIVRRLTHGLLRDASKNDRLEGTVALVKEDSKVAASELNPVVMDLLNVQNGMLDWRTGILKPYSPEYRSTFQIAAPYVPGERSEALDRFLEEVFPQDALLLAEELVGYLLRATTKFQKAFMLLGDGANGKSTFLSMLTTFLGEDSVSNISLQDLVENRFAAAELQGKLVNIYADLPSSSLEQSDVFKAIVGGDTIKAERKFGQPFKLTPTARLLFSANDLPRSRDLSSAYFRRWVIIPFPNKFEDSKAKKDLLGLLTTQQARSALLNRAVEGLRRLEAQQGFTTCASVQAAGEAYRRQCDPAIEFISERLEATPGSVLGKTEVYDMFKQWTVAAGRQSPESQAALNQRLVQVLCVVEKRMRRAGRFERVWVGLSWKAETGE